MRWNACVVQGHNAVQIYPRRPIGPVLLNSLPRMIAIDENQIEVATDAIAGIVAVVLDELNTATPSIFPGLPSGDRFTPADSQTPANEGIDTVQRGRRRK